jgi:hypothetical protein
MNAHVLIAKHSRLACYTDQVSKVGSPLESPSETCVHVALCEARSGLAYLRDFVLCRRRREDAQLLIASRVEFIAWARCRACLCRAVPAARADAPMLLLVFYTRLRATGCGYAEELRPARGRAVPIAKPAQNANPRLLSCARAASGQAAPTAKADGSSPLRLITETKRPTITGRACEAARGERRHGADSNRGLSSDGDGRPVGPGNGLRPPPGLLRKIAALNGVTGCHRPRLFASENGSPRRPGQSVSRRPRRPLWLGSVGAAAEGRPQSQLRQVRVVPEPALRL